MPLFFCNKERESARLNAPRAAAPREERTDAQSQLQPSQGRAACAHLRSAAGACPAPGRFKNKPPIKCRRGAGDCDVVSGDASHRGRESCSLLPSRVHRGWTRPVDGRVWRCDMRTTLPRCLVLSVCICLECNVALASFGVLSRSKPLVLDSDQNQSVKKFCQQHRKEARLRRFCSVDPGLVQAIVHGTRLTVDSCQSLFQWEPWQCDLLQDKRRHLLKKVYRETALVYALAAAGLTHSVARGCSSGRLSSRCSCNESGSRTLSATESDQNWKWGGCGDNYSFSAKFSRKLLARNKSRRPRTLRRPVDNHNLVVGIRVLRHGIRRVCKCHGLSGSCSAKTCWEELAHFPDVAKALKRKYSKAIMAQVENKPDFASTEVVSKLKKTLLTRTTQKPKWLRAVTAELQRLGRDRLVYLEESPSFCERNVLTGGMSQRRCRDHAHCEQVCCGRGHRSFSETVQERCHCRVVWCCQLECKTCTVLKYSHSCH